MGGHRRKGRFDSVTKDYWTKPFTARPMKTAPYSWRVESKEGAILPLTNIGSQKPQFFDVMNLVLANIDLFEGHTRFKVVGGKPRRVRFSFTASELESYHESLKLRAARATSESTLQPGDSPCDPSR